MVVKFYNFSVKVENWKYLAFWCRLFVTHRTLYFPSVIWYKIREKVTTTNVTTLKTKKNIEKFANHHYIESPFLVDHYYYNQNIESLFLVDHYYNTFNVLILPMASKKITTSKIKISTTYGILPMVTKACGALGG